jgi:hypothetical protein
MIRSIIIFFVLAVSFYLYAYISIALEKPNEINEDDYVVNDNIDTSLFLKSEAKASVKITKKVLADIIVPPKIIYKNKVKVIYITKEIKEKKVIISSSLSNRIKENRNNSFNISNNNSLSKLELLRKELNYD